MARSTDLADLFRRPALASQRHYEICKAYFLDETPAAQLAGRFSLHVDSVRAIVRDFAAQPDLEQFFVVKQPGRHRAPLREELAEWAAQLRGQGLRLLEIQERLKGQGHTISASYLSRILAQQGSPEPATRPAAALAAATAPQGGDRRISRS
jgi:hypothetical protein